MREQNWDRNKIWHFTHVSSGAKLGLRNYRTKRFIGNKVVIGNRCKIQNNVSVYDNVTLDDGVLWTINGVYQC